MPKGRFLGLRYSVMMRVSLLLCLSTWMGRCNPACLFARPHASELSNLWNLFTSNYRVFRDRISTVFHRGSTGLTHR